MQGPLASNEKLHNATKLFEGEIDGSGEPLTYSYRKNYMPGINPLQS